MKPDDPSMARGLASDYYKAAEEDYELLEYIHLTEFSYYGNGCMLAAHYAEKIMKTHLLVLRIDVGWATTRRSLSTVFQISTASRDRLKLHRYSHEFDSYA